MLSFKQYLQEETVSDHAKKLMATGKYPPHVRGSGSAFARDLIATGITKSTTTANLAYSAHKHLHKTPTPQTAPAKEHKPEVKSAPKASNHSMHVLSKHGEKLHVGDAVGYKDDHEKYGTIHKIESSNTVHVKSFDSVTGEHYIHQRHPKELWKED